MTTGGYNFNAPIWQDFFNTDETGQKTAFFGQLPQNLSGSQQRFAQNLFQPTFNRYLGKLGQQIMGGGNPTRSFTDFLTEDFNVQKELLRSPESTFSQGSSIRSPARYFFAGR